MDIESAVAFLGIPSSAGAWSTGQEKAPDRLRSAGLLDRLKSRGIKLQDAGDAPSVAFRPDNENKKAKNIDLVRAVAQDAARRIDKIVGDGALPLVLGGGCTITIGVLAGLARHYKRLGLIYFDGDLDLNVPAVSPSGTLDGMVVSHIIGQGDRRLSHIAGVFPLVPPERVVMFAFNAEAGWIDPYEQDTLERSAMLSYPIRQVRKNPLAAGHEVLAKMRGVADHFLLHFDLDALDGAAFPAVDARHEFGLGIAETINVLRLFRASPQCIGLVVTEFNPDLDMDGKCALTLVDIIDRVLR
jgi:arginase